MGKDARTLEGLFGPPDLDVREGPARKLQYASSVCVLDAYLYPPAQGRELRAKSPFCGARTWVVLPMPVALQTSSCS